MRYRTFILLAVTVFLSIVNCWSQQSATSQHMVVYKMSANYANLVPVTLSADKKTIVSFPDPADIKDAGASAIPQKLHKGYYLDNRGINEHTAFLNISYKQYSVFKETPSAEQLYGELFAKEGITRICDCGARSKFRNPKAEINKLIDNGLLLKKCKTLKWSLR